MKKDIAVVIVDMQNFFLQNFPISVSNKLVENQRQIINLCLKKKMPFVLLEYKAGGIFRGKTISKLEKLIKNSIIETIVKESNGGFTDTNLDTTLKNLNIGTVVLMGLNANGCIQDTAIGSIRRGYKVVTSQGIIASSSRKDLSLSKRNKEWYLQNTKFFESPTDLMSHLESV